ncbi:hypothetical protein HPB48_005298 [Haemaphysalis longicornis]|uniref:Peptidase S1 domain-containing protein n=1 Tax=Haemaphysalis longicornis TaxID=44386 RepID=A0A9J6GF26_HAELO|nr:hypothetical protein HPB48_005298 [Haemaphysalis longicornis]
MGRTRFTSRPPNRLAPLSKRRRLPTVPSPIKIRYKTSKIRHRNNTEFFVRIGSLEISKSRVRGKASSSQTVERKVKMIHLHPSYNGKRQNADLALLLLHKDADVTEQQLPAACLPEEAAAPDIDRGVILGWGHNGFGGKLQTNLQEADVPIIGNEKCDPLYKKLGTYGTVFHHGVDQDFLCAGNITEGGVDACQCGLPGFPGVYTRVSTFIPWILHSTGKIAKVKGKVTAAAIRKRVMP